LILKRLVLPFAAAGNTLFAMTTISLKIPEALLREITQEAEARRVAKSAVIRDCIERTLRRGKKARNRVTCLDLMGDWVGSFRGPRDLSANRRYLVEAITAHANRGRKSSR
jgi:hypothetical protein